MKVLTCNSKFASISFSNFFSLTCHHTKKSFGTKFCNFSSRCFSNTKSIERNFFVFGALKFKETPIFQQNQVFFCLSSRRFHSSPFLKDTTPSFPEHIFHKEADETLYSFLETLEETLEDSDLDDFDVTYSDGILTIKLGSRGSYVLNKQTPNRQIWFSSPVSGPKRYNFDEKKKLWFNSRDGHELSSFLSQELTELLGIQVKLS